ncbi:SRPBCC domain-containing protein [Leptospira bouyouniensis]|uniref:Activator of HSP90 ATPase n=1 Tax=Leptospira bouyouniensis TaxID=2484911 RepID=A0ABY2L139_9LEPT|nr:SRPBCC domain-containing protein [Leptospira bouyouniensis]TGK47008.1 activator of HSP90 ATPase [Leptospira bouyouniensis]
MPSEIQISVSIASDLKKVWDYYTNPTHITAWNFADPSWHCPSAKVNLTKGGTYLARMEAKDGSFGFDFEATFDEINMYDSFTYTIADQRKVKVQFFDKKPNTEIIIVFEAETENPIEIQKQGWQSILNHFKSYVETH